MTNQLYKIIADKAEERMKGKMFPLCISLAELTNKAGISKKQLSDHLNKLYLDGHIGFYNAINDKMIYPKKMNLKKIDYEKKNSNRKE